MVRVAIVGGGISGMTLAYRLQQSCPDANVQVIEGAGQLGGTISTLDHEGFRVEAGPNGFLDNNPSTMQLCRELALDRELIPASAAARKNRYLLLDGRLRRLPSGLFSFLGSGVLSYRAKLDLLLERFRRPVTWRDDESIDSFARRRAGDEAAETLVDAFVTGIFAGDSTLLSMPACLPRIAAYERDHGSVQRGMAAARKQRRAKAAARGEPVVSSTRMWSFSGGLGTLIAGLKRRLRLPPITGTPARVVVRQGNRWIIELCGLGPLEADLVALMCPAHQQAVMLSSLDDRLAGEIAGIAYNHVAVVALGYLEGDVPMSLDGFGYLSRQRERRDVLGVQWCSTIFSDRAPRGSVLLRAMCGGWQRPEMIDWDDQRLVGAVRAELAKVMHIQAAPVFQHIVRWEKAIPQYHLGHLDRVARIEALAAQHPGLYLGGNAYRGVALNDCVEQAGRLAEQIAAGLRKETELRR